MPIEKPAEVNWESIPGTKSNLWPTATEKLVPLLCVWGAGIKYVPDFSELKWIGHHWHLQMETWAMAESQESHTSSP